MAFGFWDFSIDPMTCWLLWKNPKPFKRFTCWAMEAINWYFTHLPQGSPMETLHDHLRSVMSMHLWRFFLHFFEFFCIFWVNWTIERSPVLKKKFKKILVQVAPEPSTVEMVRDLVLWKRAVLLKREVWCRVGGCGLAWILAGVRSHARSFPSGKMRIGVRPKEKLKGLMKGALNISL